MAININNVVNTNFNVIKSVAPLSSYGNTVVMHQSSEVVTTTIKTFSSYDSAVEEIENEPGFSKNKYDAFIYFTLGGRKLTSMCFPTSSTMSEMLSSLLNYKKSVSNTDDDFVCFTYDLSTSVQGAFQAIVTFINELTAPNKLLLLVNDKNLKDAGIESQPIGEEYDRVVCKYAVVKQVSGGKITTTDSTCMSQLTIAAYLSKINLSNSSVMRDYCYTNESAITNYVSENFDRTITVSNVDQDTYEDYIKWTNFIDLIGNNIVNFGGNTVTGKSIIAEFGAVCSENAVTFAVLRVMLAKQYLTDAGLNNIVSEINNILQDYINNGFIDTGSTYIGETKYYTYNNMSYKVVEKNEQLPNGYVIVTIPMSRISVADKAAKRFTPIYIYMQTLGGARTVEITGDILD